MLNWLDYVLILFAFVGLSMVLVGVWRGVHGGISDGWRSKRFRSGRQIFFYGVAILIFALVLAPSAYQGRGRQKSNLTICQSNLKNIAIAAEMYQTDHPDRFPDSLSQLTPNYLRVLPECPSAGEVTYSASYQHADTDSEPAFFRVSCQGQHHQNANVKTPDRPAYDSREGLIEL